MDQVFEKQVSLIKNVISEALNSEKINVNAKKITTEGANYLGNLFLLDVEENGNESHKLFAKVSNIPAEARIYIPLNQVYKNEVIMYTTVAKEFDEIQEKHNVPYEKRFIFPKFYGSNLNELEEVVVLENLADKGYEMYDRFKSLNWEFSRAAVEELAKFHALSFALKKENPETFECLTKSVTNYFFENPANDPKQFLDIARSKVQVIDEEYRERILKYIDDAQTQLFLKHVQPTTQYSVIVHGDYRSSNILVKYEGDSVVSLKPVDYQTATYGNPVSDLMYLLFTGTDGNFRQKYFERFVEHYHDSLKNQLELFSLNVDNIYPKSAFYFELKDRLLYGLEIGLFLLATVLSEPDDTIDMGDLVSEDDVRDAFGNQKSSGIFVERLNEIVKDFVRWDFLPDCEKNAQNGRVEEDECSEKLESIVLSEE